VISQHRAEGVPVTLDTEWIRKRDRDFATSVSGDENRLGEGFLTFRPVETVAFKKNPLGIGHHPFVNIRRHQKLGDAEIRVHRALTIRSDKNDAATRFRRMAVRCRAGVEDNPLGAHVIGEGRAKLVVLDLADKRGPTAKLRYAGDRVRHRTAGDLPGGTDPRVEIDAPVYVYQLHDPFPDAVHFHEGLVAVGENVDQRVSDSHHLKPLGHVLLSSKRQNSSIGQAPHAGLRALQM